MASLTDEQLSFLETKGVPLSKVFDATGMSKGEYQAAMKPLELWLAFGVTPCKEAGHRMRTRAGHCVQCDPAKISFIARHEKLGEVYVAHSPRLHYIKVGSADNAQVRIRSLNTHKYGRIDDWKLIYKASFAQSGNAEFLVHKALKAHHSPRANSDGASSIESQELFSCAPEVAVKAIQAVEAQMRR